jgi:uncharacterized protein (TIGR02246 family)
MRRKGLLAVIAWLVLAPIQAQEKGAGPAMEDPAHEELRAMKRQLVEASNKGDFDRVLTLLDQNVIVTWQNGEVSRGPNEVKAYLERMTKGPNRIVQRFETSPEVAELTHLYGDTGVAYGDSRDLFVLTDGREFVVPTRWSATVVKKDGRWLIANFHASTNMFDNPILSLAIRRTAMWVGGVAVIVGLVLGLLVGRLFRRRAATA